MGYDSEDKIYGWEFWLGLLRKRVNATNPHDYHDHKNEAKKKYLHRLFYFRISLKTLLCKRDVLSVIRFVQKCNDASNFTLYNIELKQNKNNKTMNFFLRFVRKVISERCKGANTFLIHCGMFHAFPNS